MHSGSARTAVWSGVFATFVAMIAAYWFPAFGLPALDLAALNGAVIVPASASSTFSWAVGALQLLGGGAVMALLYAFWVQTYLPGPGWLRGLIWGGALAVVVGLTVFPLIYDGGVFGTTWDGRMPISTIAFHLLWGCLLGVVYHKQWDQGAQD